MDGVSRPPAKLQKRKSRERNDAAGAQMSGALNVPPIGSSQPMSSNNMSASEKERRSKWRLSNPFHSKDKDKDKDRPTDRKDASEFTGDSAYASSEPSSSANPSFASNPRPISGEQWHPTLASSQSLSQAQSQAPTTSLTVPTPPANGSHAPPPSQPTYASQENVFKETHQDNRTGNIVTTVTTTTTTTTTTTGPGGSTVVQQPAGADPSRASITSTSGPSPPSPAPPALDSYIQGPDYQRQGVGNFQQGVGHHQDVGYHQSLAHQPSVTQHSHDSEHEPHISIPGDSVPPMPTHHYQDQGLKPQVLDVESSSPPLPTKSNIRNRVELDSVSPGIERPNPIVDPVSPITPSSPSRANFSYPARAPPQGVPRHVPSQHFPVQQQPADPSRSYADPNYPVPASIPVAQGEYQQKQSTLANLKLAAAGIHGAGEALRGTFNDTFDRRYAGADSAAHAKNMATIQAGRSEIEAAQFSHRNRPSLDITPPLQPQPLNTKSAYQGPPVSGSQIEGKSGKLNNFMRKMKDGSMASSRDQDRSENLGTHA